MFDQCDALWRNLAKKAQGATTQRENLEQKVGAAKLKGRGNQLSAKLTQARKNGFCRKKLRKTEPKLPVTLRVTFGSFVIQVMLELLIGLKAFLVVVASWDLTTPLTCLFVDKQLLDA